MSDLGELGADLIGNAVGEVRVSRMEIDGHVDRELAFAPEAAPQGLARHERHGVPELAGSLAGVEYGQDMGGCKRAVVWISRWNRSGPQGRGQLGVQHLQRHLAVVLEVVSQVDGGHAAPPQLSLESVAARQRLLEPIPEIRHVGCAWSEGVR